MGLSSCFELSSLGGVVSLQMERLCFLESPSVAVNALSTTVLEHEHAPLYRPLQSQAGFWVAVKELKLSYYIGETLLFIIHTHYGNSI